MKIKGQLAEERAEQYLKQYGLSLLERNYQNRSGEIDLIMQDDQTVVFIEVRSRRSSRFGSAEDSIDQFKQNKIINTANHYLVRHKLMDKMACRFDVVVINQNKLEWIQNAFEDRDELG